MIKEEKWCVKKTVVREKMMPEEKIYIPVILFQFILTVGPCPAAALAAIVGPPSPPITIFSDF